MAAVQKTSQWDTKRHIAFSHVAHLGVDNVLFALVRRWQIHFLAAGLVCCSNVKCVACHNADPHSAY